MDNIACKVFNETVSKNLITGLNQLEEIITETRHLLKSCPDQGRLTDLLAKARRQALDLEGVITVLNLESGFIPEIPCFSDILKAAENLAKRRHGALIAIERNFKLDDFIGENHNMGLVIGAKLSSRLIESIFFPGNPLHDGAIIVRGKKILAAGCLLPLSRKTIQFETHLGSRHRAALGLSEITDALIVTVSEERGQISLALGGHLHVIDGYFDLRQDLINFLVRNDLTPSLNN